MSSTRPLPLKAVFIEMRLKLFDKIRPASRTQQPFLPFHVSSRLHHSTLSRLHNDGHPPCCAWNRNADRTCYKSVLSLLLHSAEFRRGTRARFRDRVKD